MMETVAGVFVTLAGYLIRWRGPYLACYGYGLFLAAQQGITVDRHAAYEMGKTAILQRGANVAAETFGRIDWKAAWVGLMHWRADVHEAFADIGRGVRRDMRKLRDWVLRRHEPEQRGLATPDDTSQRIAMLDEYAPQVGENENAGELVSGVLFDMEQRRAVLARSLADPTTKSPVADVLEHTHITERLRQHYAANPADAIAMQTPTARLLDMEPPRPQALFGATPLIAGGLMPYALAGVAGLAALVGVQSWRVDRLKDDNDALRATAKAQTATITNYRGSLAERDARISATAQQCVVEIESAQAAKLRAEQAAAAEKRRRINVQRATIESGGSVPLADILRNLPGAGGGIAASSPADPDPGELRE